MIETAIALIPPVFYLAGLLSAIDALLRMRNVTGTTAWILGLLFLPYVAVPLYWFIGRARFPAYAEKLERFESSFAGVDLPATLHAQADDEYAESDEESDYRALEKLGDSRFVGGNSLQLLVDGEEMYPALFELIDTATDYLLVQFYVIRADGIGTKFKERLLAAIGRGVRVFLLYDEIGSIALPDTYIDELRDAGIHISNFSGGYRVLRRFRLNFRNHRKVVVADGNRGLVGGLNVGDEYLGKDPDIGPWRDTHARIDGPATSGLQFAFLRDWHFATGEVPEKMYWDVGRDAGSVEALVASSGPHDDFANCGLLYTQVISMARRRLWLATPYFVPDDRVLGALEVAAMRGVDVRVLVPEKSDNALFRYVPFAFFPKVMRAGVRIFMYPKGFMHQKVMLVDDDLGVISTANLDNRSFNLNFEISLVARNTAFAGKVDAMLQDDLAVARELDAGDVNARSLVERFATRVTRLFAPVL